jgi:hypothetical protein
MTACRPADGYLPRRCWLAGTSVELAGNASAESCVAYGVAADGLAHAPHALVPKPGRGQGAPGFSRS